MQDVKGLRENNKDCCQFLGSANVSGLYFGKTDSRIVMCEPDRFYFVQRKNVWFKLG